MAEIAFIGFRETFEVALVVIAASAALRCKHAAFMRSFAVGLLCGLFLSLAAGLILWKIPSLLAGRLHAIYLGCLLLSAAALLTWMLLRNIAVGSSVNRLLSSSLDRNTLRERARGISLLGFTTTAWEGTELMIFTQASLLPMDNPATGILALSGGIIVAAVLGMFLHRGITVIRSSHFFAVTNVILLLVCASLIAKGIGTLEQAAYAPLPSELSEEEEEEYTKAGMAAAAAFIAITGTMFYRKRRLQQAV